MNYAIIENNPSDLMRLKAVVSQCLPQGQLAFTAATVQGSIACLSNRPALDLLFMDVELDDGTCFDIFNQTTIDTPVIFTTAYNDYIFKAFKVNCVDYLLKPITPDMLRNALCKFQLLFSPDATGTSGSEISS